jgi:glycosyltransferase involved in cell wall biosynthesis
MSPLIAKREPPHMPTSPLIAHREPDSDGVPGILVTPDDVPALAGALRRWFDEPELRTAIRRSAAARRDTLTGWEVTSRCLARVLDRLNSP